METPVVLSREVGLAEVYTSSFTGVADLTSVLKFQFTDARMLRSLQTVSYDVTVTNVSAEQSVTKTAAFAITGTPTVATASGPLADGALRVALDDARVIGVHAVDEHLDFCVSQAQPPAEIRPNTHDAVHFSCEH